MPFFKGHLYNKGRKQTFEHKRNVQKAVLQRRVNKNCLQCSNTFSVPPCRKEVVKFCTKICYSLFLKGKPSWNAGLKGFRAGEKRPYMCLKGEEHWSYIKDRSLLQRNNDESKQRRSSAYNEWVKNVRNRDGWKCKISNIDCLGRLETHHILNWKENPKLRYEINNGITLCHFHHPRKRIDEKKLSPYFQKLLLI